MKTQPAEGTWSEVQAAIAGKVTGDNGKTVSGAGPSTPGPKLTPKIALGNARPTKLKG
ncbi:hypothetical protein [Bradyrhizobium sp. MOS002]|uniref:hypothetical protein n=1 Tax=Bradyrhizobium sp. MOS002 TaxID=2133947 RepID=UPI0013050461|nr:hypothetical protein [Bradyrhizobium sp. MOS002]